MKKTEDANVRRLVHELEVHQVELQVQNEELREARLEIEAGLERYTELFDFAPIGYVALTPEATIVALNHAGARLLGCERGALVGRRFAPMVAAHDLPGYRAMLGKALDGDPKASCEIELAGRGTRLRLTATALTHSKPSVLIAFEDITEQKAREQQLACTERALREADQRKNEFLGALSHELRNPLAPILSSLFMLGEAAPGSQDASRAREVLERQVGHLTSIIDDLLDVTRISRGKIHLKRSSVELRQLLTHALEDQQSLFANRGVRLEGRFQPGVFWVDADANRLLQIVNNLLGNAYKFTPPGGSVSLTLERRDEQALIRVRDTGVGIAPEMLQQVFEPFHQAPQSMDRTEGGLGLGLAMVKGLVDAHGGSVAIFSEGLGKGTTLEILLPLVKAPVATASTGAPLPPNCRRVLVIDDNQDAADGLAEVLRVRGHEAKVAYDGPSALELARKFVPEVVICDIGLPQMDGYAVAKAMRAELRTIFLVALSGYARPADKLRAQKAGFDLHVAKPAKVDEIDRIVTHAPSP